MKNDRAWTLFLVPLLVLALPCLMGPKCGEEGFDTDGNPDPDDDDGDDDASDDDDGGGDDDGADDDDSDDDDDDTGSGDDDTGENWLITWTDTQCEDLYDYSEWTFTCQLSTGGEFVWVTMDDGNWPEDWHLQEDGATYIWTTMVSSLWETGYDCWGEFDLTYTAVAFGGGTEYVYGSWP